MDELEKELEAMIADAEAELEGGDTETVDDEINEEEQTGSSEEEEGEVDEQTEDTTVDESKDTETEDSVGDGGDGHEDESIISGEARETKDEFQPIEVEVAGHKVSIKSKEDLMAYVKAGADTFTKEDDKFKEETSIIESEKLSADDLKLLVEAKNGNKEALAKLATDSNIDLLDVENKDSENYKQQQEYYTPTEVDKVADTILNDTEHHKEFTKVISGLPQEFVGKISTDATMLRDFSRHIKDGIAQQIIPDAITAQMKYGGDFLTHYAKVGNELLAKANKKTETQQREVTEREKSLREKASQNSNRSSQKSNSGSDVWDLSDEDFENLDLSTIK